MRFLILNEVPVQDFIWNNLIENLNERKQIRKGYMLFHLSNKIRVVNNSKRNLKSHHF